MTESAPETVAKPLPRLPRGLRPKSPWRAGLALGLALFCSLGLGIGLLVQEVIELENRLAAAEALRQQGALVLWQHERHLSAGRRPRGDEPGVDPPPPPQTESWHPEAKPPGPWLLRALLGQHFFSSVDTVVLDLTQDNSPILEELTRLPELRQLRFGLRPRLDDRGSLVELQPDVAWPNDLRLGPLPSLPRLRQIHALEQPALGHYILQQLPSMPGLRVLDLKGTDLRNDALTQLAFVPQLEILDLSDTSVADEDLANLESTEKLRKLNLARTHVTDDGLVHISHLYLLNDLNLSETRITDARLIHLDGLTHLKRLNLSGARIHDAGFANLQRLPRLEHLDLSYTEVTDLMLKSLVGLPRLQSLDLSGNQITNAALDELSYLPKLKTLNLSHTRISDDGLPQLRTLRQLQKLNLSETEVTPRGASQLREVLPKLEVAM